MLLYVIINSHTQRTKLYSIASHVNVPIGLYQLRGVSVGHS